MCCSKPKLCKCENEIIMINWSNINTESIFRCCAKHVSPSRVLSRDEKFSNAVLLSFYQKAFWIIPRQVRSCEGKTETEKLKDHSINVGLSFLHESANFPQSFAQRKRCNKKQSSIRHNKHSTCPRQEQEHNNTNWHRASPKIGWRHKSRLKHL